MTSLSAWNGHFFKPSSVTIYSRVENRATSGYRLVPRPQQIVRSTSRSSWTRWGADGWSSPRCRWSARSSGCLRHGASARQARHRNTAGTPPKPSPPSGRGRPRRQLAQHASESRWRSGNTAPAGRVNRLWVPLMAQGAVSLTWANSRPRCRPRDAVTRTRCSRDRRTATVRSRPTNHSGWCPPRTRRTV
jgi:hypothetical protein